MREALRIGGGSGLAYRVLGAGRMRMTCVQMERMTVFGPKGIGMEPRIGFFGMEFWATAALSSVFPCECECLGAGGAQAGWSCWPEFLKPATKALATSKTHE